MNVRVNSFPAMNMYGILQRKIERKRTLIKIDSIEFSSLRLSKILGFISCPKDRNPRREKKAYNVKQRTRVIVTVLVAFPLLLSLIDE